MRPRTVRSERRGFALVAVLWILVSVAAIGAMLTAAARESVATAQNRLDLLRAAWRAEGCVEAARSVVDGALAADNSGIGTRPAWARLNVIVSQSPLVTGCSLSLRPGGTTIDVNTADSTRLVATFVAAGQTAGAADSLVDALLDWRDADHTPRADGAEEEWYEAQRRPGPRDGPLESPDELALVRGFDRIAGVDTLLGVEDERVYLDGAPLAVLASLPGMDAEAIAFVAERRMRGAPIGDVASLAAALSATARQDLLTHYPELVQLTTSTPDAWTITSRASAGAPPLTATIELRLVKAGGRAAIVRRRSWP